MGRVRWGACEGAGPGRTPARQEGFTLVEVIVSMVILAVVVLGMGSAVSGLIRTSGETEVQALAVQAVEDRIAEVMIDPRYAQLESLYEGEEDDLEGLPGHVRTTTIEAVEETIAGAGEARYKLITVTVEGPGLDRTIRRAMLVGAP